MDNLPFSGIGQLQLAITFLPISTCSGISISAPETGKNVKNNNSVWTSHFMNFFLTFGALFWQLKYQFSPPFCKNVCSAIILYVKSR